MFNSKKNILLFLLALMPVLVAQEHPKKGVPEYTNPGLSAELRAADALTYLTLEEKIALIGGDKSEFDTKKIEHLGIPALSMTDGPLGVRWDKATAFPSGISMGASFDPMNSYYVGEGIARDVKAKGRNVILGPCVNIARIPQGGRNFESFGEDPYLTSRMAVDYINGVQKNGVVATVKHFAANNQELERTTVDTKVDRRTLEEIYFPAFKAAVQEADVKAVMCAYNKLNGDYCAENNFLLIDKLKKEWGFKYLVMSDWGAVHSSIGTAMGGLDLEMPSSYYLSNDSLLNLVKTGKIPESVIDDKVIRILTVIFKMGYFERYGDVKIPEVNSPENRKIARETAKAGMVLLKNDSNTLPIDLSKVKSIAVVGPNAEIARTGGGGSSQVAPVKAISPLEAITARLGNKVKIRHCAGITLSGDASPINSKLLFQPDKDENGLKAEYFNNIKLEGTPVLIRIDNNLPGDFDKAESIKGIGKENFSVRWTGRIKAAETGTFTLDARSDDGVRVWLDDKLIVDDWTDHAPKSAIVPLKLEAGKYYKIKYEFYQAAGGAYAGLSLREPDNKYFGKAIEIAKNSDLVLVFVGTSNEFESEGFDRDNLTLPYGQDELIKEVSKVNKNVVVVLTSGSPVIVEPWLSGVKGLLETWFAGEEIGNATLDILLGDYNPGGKLPVTFPVKYEDCSAAKYYNKTKHLTEYKDSIFVGYRHFEHYGIKPSFPFGFGLSYTTFDISNLKLSSVALKEDDKLEITVDVKNTGLKEGAEVVQLYIRDNVCSVSRPNKELKGFKKVSLKAGEVKTVKFTISKEDLSFFDIKTNKFIAEPGEFSIFVGNSSDNCKLVQNFMYK